MTYVLEQLVSVYAALYVKVNIIHLCCTVLFLFLFNKLILSLYFGYRGFGIVEKVHRSKFVKLWNPTNLFSVTFCRELHIGRANGEFVFSLNPPVIPYRTYIAIPGVLTTNSITVSREKCITQK